MPAANNREYLQTHAFLGMAAQPGTLNEGERTVDCLFYSGADVSRSDGYGHSYLLRFDPKGADLSLLNNGAPVLDSHSTFEGCGAQLGKVERAWERGGKYYATLRFSRRKDPKAEGVWTDIKDGILTKFSMGVELVETTDQRDKSGNLEVRTAKKWRPFEISVVSVPADFSTTTLQRGRDNGIPRSRKVEVDLAKLGQK